MPTDLRPSLEALFDDAGLFPPARYPMADALARHDRARSGPYRQLVGPFLCPAGRLDELDACVAGGLPRPERMGIVLYAGAMVSPPAWPRGGVVQFEGPLGVNLPDGDQRVRRFLELPPTGDVEAAIAQVALQRAGAKVRCGGATPDMVPSPGRLAEIIAGCAVRRVPFKATAGLHQPFRHLDAELGVAQHGFINLMAAASAAVAGAEVAELEEILVTTAEPDGPGPAARVDRRSRELLSSIGTCSLEEPIEALNDLGLLS